MSLAVTSQYKLDVLKQRKPKNTGELQKPLTMRVCTKIGSCGWGGYIAWYLTSIEGVQNKVVRKSFFDNWLLFGNEGFLLCNTKPHKTSFSWAVEAYIFLNVPLDFEISKKLSHTFCLCWSICGGAKIAGPKFSQKTSANYNRQFRQWFLDFFSWSFDLRR